jgi:HEAT repeat protein
VAFTWALVSYEHSMGSRLTLFLQIRTGEARMAVLVAALFGLVEAGRGIGSNAVDALFFLRFGVQFLPYMYILLGAATFIVAVSYTAALGKLNRKDLYIGSLGLCVLIVLLEWAAIHLDLPLLYPLLWISINVVSAVLALQVWHVAGEVTDTRQAKRLNSIFISGGIFGSLIGNVATGRLAQLLGTQNLLVVYAALLLASFFLTIQIARRFFAPPQKMGRRVGVWTRLREGFDYERGSRMLRLLSYSSVVFSILFFSVSFPFSRVVSSSFPNEADVASFLGLFSAAATLITLIVSLGIANRLYAKFGLVNAVLVLPFVYLGGFILWGMDFSLATAVMVRLAQMVILGGLASPAWSSLYNVAPPERRAAVLGFDAAVPSQAGVVLSGVLLILAGRGLGNSQIFALGAVVAVVCAYLIWQMRSAYGEALVQALRAGRLEVFSGSVGAFSRLQSDSNALNVALSALHDARASTRRLAAEILTRMNAHSAIPALVSALKDDDVEVRVASLRALGKLGTNVVEKPVIEMLADWEPSVRTCALEVLVELHVPSSPSILSTLRQLLEDPKWNVRAQAAVVLASMGETESALPELNSLLRDADPEMRVAALGALGQIAAAFPGRGNGSRFEITAVIQATADQMPAVRRAACQTLGKIGDEAAIQALIRCLDDTVPTVRITAAESLRGFGGKATASLVQVLKDGTDPAQEAALEAFTPDDPKLLEPLSEYARREIAQILTWRELGAVIPPGGGVTKLVREMLSSRSAQSELRLVKTVGLLGNREAMGLVAKSLKSHDAETRAEAVETLETLGDKRLAKTIIPLLEDAIAIEDRAAALTPMEALAHLMSQKDAWARALAARAAAELGLNGLMPNLKVMEREDHDPLAREAAHEAFFRLAGNKEEVVSMETLQTVSSLERIILLREVPLFAELSPDDLKQIADVAREQLYPAGSVLFREGEEGDELYVLASGQVRVTKGSNGTERTVAKRGVGEFLGEMAIFESAERSATVRAEGDVRALVIDANAFKSILRDRPEVSLAVLRVLSRRLREMM